MKKRFLSGLLAGVMLLSMLTCAPALAAPGETPPGDGTPDDGQENHVPTLHNVIPVREEPITEKTIYWEYPGGSYPYCMITITNNSDKTMTGHLKFPSTGNTATDSAIVAMNALQLGKLNSIAPYSQVIVTLKSTPAGLTELYFTSPNGIQYGNYGTVRVDASNEPF